jgi:hypothetical protein
MMLPNGNAPFHKIQESKKTPDRNTTAIVPVHPSTPKKGTELPDHRLVPKIIALPQLSRNKPPTHQGQAVTSHPPTRTRPPYNLRACPLRRTRGAGCHGSPSDCPTAGRRGYLSYAHSRSRPASIRGIDGPRR